MTATRPRRPPTGPLPIVVEQHLAMDATGTLRLVFDADPWDSTISFAPGIPVALGGTLDLTFAAGVDVATQSGRTIDLFDWTGVTPTGAFTVSSPYTWNLSNLYTTGEVTLAAVPSHARRLQPRRHRRRRRLRRLAQDRAAHARRLQHLAHPLRPTVGSGSVASANATVPEPTTLVMLILEAVGVSIRRRCRTWPVSKLVGV